VTCIVGVEQGGKVYLGADSIAIEDYQAFSILDPKVFAVGEFVIGFCSSLRVGQLIRYGLQAPSHPKGKGDMDYLVMDFMDALRALLRDKGVLKKENDEETFDGKLLLGYRGHLYYVDEDFQVGRVKEGYCSIGAGSDVALGSLFSTEHISDPHERMTIALNACVRWNAGVRPPFNYVCSDGISSKARGKKNKRAQEP
jgi:hypothetical protein